MVELNGLKPLSARLLALVTAIVFFVSGTNFGISEFALDYSQALILIFLGIILFIEVGIKKFTPLSTLRRVGFLQWISLAVAAVLVLGGVFALPFVPLETPSAIAVWANIGVVIGSIMIALEAWMN